MSFIGVICEKKYENYVHQVLKENLKKENVIVFSNENITNLKNVKFEIVAVMSKQSQILSKKEVLKNTVEKAKYLVVNADEEIKFDNLENININLVTYGFNSKSTITASSVNDENIMLCVQRSLKDCTSLEIEPQEISIQKSGSKVPTNIVLGIATVLLLKGIKEIKT